MKVSVTSALIVLTCALGMTQAYVNHGEACDTASSTTDCNPRQDTICEGGICQCVNPLEMEYSEDNEKCVVHVGGHCKRPDTTSSVYTCVPHAYCNYGAERTCRCNSGYSPDDVGHCMGSYGYLCNSTVECNPKDLLECSFNVCRCPSPMNDIHKRESHRCHTKVGAPCTPNVGPNTVTCDPEVTQCLADSQSITGYSCKCKAGFHLEHYERQCVRSYGTECTYDSVPRCDTVAGLVCYDGKCVCDLAPDQAWDPARKACASLEGVGCNLDDPEHRPWYDDEYFFHCFTGLTCVPFQNHQFEGICRRNRTIF